MHKIFAKTLKTGFSDLFANEVTLDIHESQQHYDITTIIGTTINIDN